MSLDQIFHKQSRTLVLIEAVVLLALVGWADWATGWEISLFVFYAFPIFLVVWYVDRTKGLIFAVASALVWYLANMGVRPWANQWGYLWATATRLVYFSFVAVGGAALRAQRDAARVRIEAFERTRALEREIVRVSEHEQQRIGRDLHDGLCQELAAISIAASSLSQELEKRHLLEARSAREIESLVKNALVEARGMARGVFPVQMDDAGLMVALDELVATTNRLVPVVASFESRGEIRISNPEISMHLYRIAQEALSNAIKHSRAGEVIIELAAEGDIVDLKITDNGQGVKDSGIRSGMGLRTMTYRANTIGADFSISARPSGGTIVSCIMRLSTAASVPTPAYVHTN